MAQSLWASCLPYTSEGFQGIGSRGNPGFSRVHTLLPAKTNRPTVEPGLEDVSTTRESGDVPVHAMRESVAVGTEAAVTRDTLVFGWTFLCTTRVGCVCDEQGDAWSVVPSCKQ